MQILLSSRGGAPDGGRKELLMGRQQFSCLCEELEAQGSFLAELFEHEPLVEATDLEAGAPLLLEEPVSPGVSPAEWDEFLEFLNRAATGSGVRIAEV